MLSIRGQKNVSDLSTPWKYLPKVVPYDPETNPSGPISFATAENARVQPEIVAFANKVTIPPQAFRYPYCSLPPLNKAVATHVNDYFNPFTPVQEEEVRVTAAATALHHVLAYSLAEPGEAILTSKPYYGRFEIDFAYEAGVSVVAAETDHEECFEEKVVERFEDALRRSKEGGVQVKCVLLVNPHNPLGRCYPRSTLVAIMRFCAKHSLHLISDEVYALSVFSNPSAPDAPPFTSILSIDTTDIINPNLVHVTYGFSKDFGAAGLKLGVLISRNGSLRQAVQAVIRFHGASGPSLAIATAMLEDRTWCREYVAIARERIADAYRYTTKRLNEMGVKYLEGGNAGFFLWVNLAPLLPPESVGVSDDEREYALTTRFLDGGVVLQPGEEHSVWKGWFRIVFTMEQWMLEEGLRRFEAVVRDLNW